MSAHRSKTLPERAQELFGVTRSELMVATCILGLCSASLLYKWWLNPADPLEQQLNARIRRTMDSLTARQDSIDAQATTGSDTTSADSAITSTQKRYARKRPPVKPIELNTARVDVLQQLPGVGPALARRIVAKREKRLFRRPEDLMLVPGIGPKVYAKIRKHVFVLRAPEAPGR